VLHMDLFDFYGGESGCSLNLEQLNGLVGGGGGDSAFLEEDSNDASSSGGVNSKYSLPNLSQPVPLLESQKSIPFQYKSPLKCIPKFSHPNNASFVSQQINQRKNRQYAIDMQSKFLFCSGPMVKLLIESRIGRYLEFKCVDAISIYLDGKWAKVPCSKGEIFKSKIISLKDKRYMTRFMKLCMDENAVEQLSHEEKSMQFVHYLREKQKLSHQLIRVICFAITLMNSLDESLTVQQGLKRVQMYIESIGRYGTTSFLYPVYGLSELPQSFCRVSAVYGGTYVLKSSLQNLVVEKTAEGETTCTGVQCNLGQKINVQRVICSTSFGERDDEDHVELKTEQQQSIHSPAESPSSIIRCISITKQPILDPFDFKNQSNPRQMYHPHSGALLMIVPPHTFGEEQTHCINIVQLDFTSKVCPKDEYVISFQTECQNEDILKKCVETFVKETYEETVREQVEAVRTAEKDNELATEDVEDVVDSSDGNATESEKLSREDINPPPSEVRSRTVQQQNILYQVCYRYDVRDGSQVSPSQSPLHDCHNVIKVNSMTSDLHCENILEEARKLFHKLYPQDVFLEQLPNPEVESQIYDENAKLLGVDQAEKNSGSSGSEKKDIESGEPKASAETEETPTDQVEESNSNEDDASPDDADEVPSQPPKSGTASVQA